jgi:UDP:flavonoid glycosyltransferase YjiC (YdhE family)
MRIVFASLGSLGDLHPILALASASRDRGHQAVIAAAATYAGLVTSFGFEFHPIRPDFTSDTMIAIFSNPKRGAARLMGEIVFPAARNTYADLLAAAQGADFLVAGELVYVAPLVAATLGLPWANAALSPQSFLSTDDPCVLPALPQIYPLRHLGPWPYRLLFRLSRSRTSAWAAPLLALEAELGVKASENLLFEGKFSPHLVLALFPPALAMPQPDWPRAVVQTGFPFLAQRANPETEQAIANFLAAGEPPIVFTLGSTVVYLATDFYQIAAEVAQQLGRRAILLMGKNPRPSAPADQVLCIDYAPHGLMFPGAVAVVHHGGVGSSAEVMRAGRPALIIPFGFDQPDNAQRLRRLGVTRVLPSKTLSRDTLLHNLRALLADTAMRDRALEVSRGIDPARDREASVAAIEQAQSRFLPTRRLKA